MAPNELPNLNTLRKYFRAIEAEDSESLDHLWLEMGDEDRWLLRVIAELPAHGIEHAAQCSQVLQ